MPPTEIDNLPSVSRAGEEPNHSLLSLTGSDANGTARNSGLLDTAVNTAQWTSAAALAGAASYGLGSLMLRRFGPVGRLAVGIPAFLGLGNLAVLGAHEANDKFEDDRVNFPQKFDGKRPDSIHNFRAVDSKVWRGSAPDKAGYEWLADNGVATIIDLRTHEATSKVDQEKLKEQGLNYVNIPIRDGQTPTAEQVQEMIKAVETSDGRVYVHCQAGVGRTGSMLASYLVSTGQENGWSALQRNLAVGPPSVEQMWFAAGLAKDSINQPPDVVSKFSRILDGPRRIWSTVK